MRAQFKEEAAVLIERMARAANEADSVVVVQNSHLFMNAFWNLVTAASLDLRAEDARAKEAGRGRIDVV